MVSETSLKNTPNTVYPNGSEKKDPVAFLDAEKKRIRDGVELFRKELEEDWLKKHSGKPIFSALVTKANPYAVDFLLSFNLVSIYDKIAKDSGLDEKQRDAMPQIVWECFLGGRIDKVEDGLIDELKIGVEAKEAFLESIKEKVTDKLRELNLKKSSNSEIKTVIASPSKKEKISLEKTTLKKALENYPKIAEQAISSTSLKIRSFSGPARPSIKNWISDYHDHLGFGKHGSIERGNFLFHSENGKKLASNERMILAEVLKSLDEDTELKIDSQNEKIIFKEVESRGLENILEKKASEKPVFHIKISSEKEQASTKENKEYSEKNETSQVPKTEDKITEKNNQLLKKVGFSADEKYKIPKKIGDLKPGPLKPAWNPAESVRKRMEEDEGKGFFSKKKEDINVGQIKTPDNIGNVKFSSPHVFPVEKKNNDSLKAPFESKAADQFRIKTSNVSEERKAPIDDSPASITKTPPLTGNDKFKSKAVFGISPSGFMNVKKDFPINHSEESSRRRTMSI